MAMFTEYLYEEGIDGIENVKKLLDEAEKKMVNKTSRDYIQFVSNFIKTNKLRPDLVEEVINCLDTWIYFESDKDNNNYTIDDIMNLRKSIQKSGKLDNDIIFSTDSMLYNIFSYMRDDNRISAINENKECWNFDAMVDAMVGGRVDIPLRSIYKNKSKIDRNWSFLPQEVFDGENDPDTMALLSNPLFKYICGFGHSSKEIKDILDNLNGYLSDDLRALVKYSINCKHFMEIIRGKDFDDKGNEIVLHDDTEKKYAIKKMLDTLGQEKMDELVYVVCIGNISENYGKVKKYSKDDAIADSVHFVCRSNEFYNSKDNPYQGLMRYNEVLLAERIIKKQKEYESLYTRVVKRKQNEGKIK